MSKNKKQKKEKVVYYDDNSTIVDMSEVSGVGRHKNSEIPVHGKSSATFKEKWNTYWSAVRMMIGPMFIVLGILAVLYLFIFFVSRGCA